MLNTAKVLVDELSTLCFSEQVEITVNNKNAQKYLHKQLNNNGFWNNIPYFLSRVFTLGTGVIKVFAQDSNPCIDYVSAENFMPLVWNSKEITSGVFQTVTHKGDEIYTLLERHFKDNQGYKIEFKLYCNDNDCSIGEEINLHTLYPNLQPIVIYSNADVKMFSVLKTALDNNVDLTSPLGISVFENATDTLKSLDTAFDSFSREFVLGRKRIIVPSNAIRTVTNPDTGEMEKYFDADDEVYEALKCESEKDLKITDNTMTLRVDEHIKSINSLLNILCFQVGLSAGTLSFTGTEGVKTATEIISRDSKTARTIKNNKNLIAECIESVCYSILNIGVTLGDIKNTDYIVTVGFKDNIIIDDNTMIDNNIKLVQSGLKSKVSAIMEVLKCDEKTAQEELAKIIKEQNVTGVAIDDFMSSGEDE